LLAAKAIREGTEPNEPALRQLVDFLMAHLTQETDRNWEVAQAIARLPVLREQPGQVLTVFEDRLSRPHLFTRNLGPASDKAHELLALV